MSPTKSNKIAYRRQGMSLYAQKPGGVEVNLTEYLKDASSNEILSAVPTSTLLSLGTSNNYKEAAKGVLAHRKSELTIAGDNQQAVNEIETGLEIWESVPPFPVPSVAGVPSPATSPTNFKEDPSDDSSGSGKRKRDRKTKPKPETGGRLKDDLDEEPEVEILEEDDPSIAPAALPRFPGLPITGVNGIARKPRPRVDRSRLAIKDEDSSYDAFSSLNEVQRDWYFTHRVQLRDSALRTYDSTPGHSQVKLQAAIKDYIHPFVRDKRNGAKTVVFRVVLEELLERHQSFQPAGCSQYEYNMLTEVMTTMFRRKNLGGPACRFTLQLEKN
jgi:hypothetical protein